MSDFFAAILASRCVLWYTGAMRASSKIPALLIGLLGLAIILFAYDAPAAEWSPFQLRAAGLTYEDYFPGGHDPLLTDNGLPNRTLGKAVELNFDIDVLKYGFFDNRVHSGTDEDADSGRGQFRTVGWEFKFGVQVHPAISLYYHHHSEHLLDASLPYHFPVRDSIGFQFQIYSSPIPRKSLF